MNIEERTKLWEESDGLIQEPWEEKCAQPGCGILWTETSGNTLYWCSCISDDGQCECERMADKGYMWCKNHIPSFLNRQEDGNYYCHECLDFMKNDESVSHKGATVIQCTHFNNKGNTPVDLMEQPETPKPFLFGLEETNDTIKSMTGDDTLNKSFKIVIGPGDQGKSLLFGPPPEILSFPK